MKPASQLAPDEPEKLKPVLHDKIERMDGQHLALLNRLLLQLEAEELAERLGAAFDKDHEQGLLRRIPELVKQFRTGHRYAWRCASTPVSFSRFLAGGSRFRRHGR
jgi:tRNA A37 N6-isopentenylltransferase MiaA